MVSKFSKNELLAKAFLTEFVATPETMKALYTAKFMIPAFLSVRKEVTNADMDAFAAMVAIGDPMPAIPAMAAYWSTMGNAFTLIYQQKGDPAQIIRMPASLHAMRLPRAVSNLASTRLLGRAGYCPALFYSIKESGHAGN